MDRYLYITFPISLIFLFLIISSIHVRADFAEECINIPDQYDHDCSFTGDWDEGEFSNMGIYTDDNDEYLRLDNTGSGTWSYDYSFDSNTEPVEIITDAEIDDKDGDISDVGIDVTVESGGTSDTISIDDDENSYDIDVDYGKSFDLEVEISNSASGDELERTTLHEIEVHYEITHTCEVDYTEIELESPEGHEEDWFEVDLEEQEGGEFCPDDEVEEWLADGYDFCPVEGEYRGRTRAYTLFDVFEDDYEMQYSDLIDPIYTVDYNEYKEWCECGDDYDHDLEWIGNVSDSEDYDDKDHLYCCGADDPDEEIWQSGIGDEVGDEACVWGEHLEHAEYEGRFFNLDGELNYCRGQEGSGDDRDWTDDFWWACDNHYEDGNRYYCGTDGNWYEGIDNSGCELVRGIRGGRIIVDE